MSSVIKRAERRHYMNTGTALAPVWTKIGEGFTLFSETKNPSSYSRRYIHEITSRTDVTGYSPVIEYAFDVFAGCAVIDIIRNITDREKTGEDAMVEVMTVDLFEPLPSGAYSASRRFYSVVPDECGSGTDALIYSGVLKAVGDAVFGMYNSVTGVFTGELSDE